MSKVFVKGDTTENGLIITWIDSETNTRSYQEIEFDDYLYIKLNTFERIKDELGKEWGGAIKGIVRKEARDEYNEQNSFIKIVLKNNFRKRALNDWLQNELGVSTYEADLDTTKRYIIDNHQNLELNILDSPYLFYDIETDDRRYFKYDERNRVVPENTILSFSATDNLGRTYFLINEDSTNPAYEKKLLLQIKEIFNKYSVVAGWNSDTFDQIYLQGRSKIYGLEDITRHVNNIDFMHSYKKYRIEEPLDSYSLDNVAQVELGEQKIETKKGGGRLYELYLTNKEKLKEYNIQDSVLLYKINKKMRFMELHLMTASKGHCPVQLTKYNIGSNDYFILMKCKERNLIAPSNPTKREKERRRAIGGIGGGYTRGRPGFYKNVATFDFSSLYPSLEITYNISPETYVENITLEDEKQYLEKKDKDIKVFKNYDEMYKHALEKNYIITPSDLTYVAKQGREIYHPYKFFKGDEIGLLPSVMIELLDERARVKKEMKKYKYGTKEYDVLYTEQLALKYMLNSNYGLNALPSYRFFRFDVADGITGSGRANIKRIRKFAEENKYDVVYSDSVSANSPIIVKDHKGNIDIIPIYDSALFNDNKNLERIKSKYKEVLTRNGFKKINYVKRHKTNKQMYRVWSRSGIVDVTEDHSLFNDKKHPMKPTELKRGDLLETREFIKQDKYKTHKWLTEDLAWCLGFYLAEGSWTKGFKKRAQMVVNGNMEELQMFKKRWGATNEIYEYKEKHGCDRLWLGDSDILKKCYTTKREKKVPIEILNSDLKTKKAFLEGFYQGDGSKNNKIYKCFYQKSKVLTMSLCYLYNEIGVQTSITKAGSGEFFNVCLLIGNRIRRKNKQEILSVNKITHQEIQRGLRKVNYGDFVYDISTEDGTFVTGISPIVVHNTDSVGITPNNNPNCPTFEKFDKMIVEFLDNSLKNSNNKIYKRTDKYGEHNHRLIMEWEKTFITLLYKKKKRYAGLIGDRINITGLKSTQMNVLAAKLQEEFIEDVLKERFDKDKWTAKMDELYRKCFGLKMEPEMLSISMKFTERADNQKRPRAHTLLAERLIKEGKDIAVGDKIKYIIQSVLPKQQAITLEEFNQTRIYPPEYYWEIFTSPLISLMSLLDNINVFDIIKVPEIEKIQNRLDKETDLDKQDRLRERISKLKEALTGNKINENEEEDTLFDNTTEEEEYGLQRTKQRIA